jgi:hypothetical protein
MAIQQNFPDEGPTLNLNFAGSRTLDPRITFTRTSSATHMGPDGLIKIVAANSPRFDHSYNSATGEIESLGLLVEESRTNLLLRSEEFETTWSATRTSVTTNAAAAPNGTTTAEKLIEDSTENNSHFVSQGVTIANATTYTFSCFVKAAERFRFRLSFSSAGFGSTLNISFNLQTSATTASAGATASIVAYPGGWFRCIATATSTATTTSNFSMLLLSDAGNSSYTGDGASGLYLWGAQLEQASFPTSYIPTTASTVTRTADNASMTGSNFSSWYRQDEGTLLSIHNRGNTSQPNMCIASIDDNSATNRIELRATGPDENNFRFEIISNSVGTFQAGIAPNNGKNNTDKVCLSYQENNSIVSYNRNLSNLDTSVSIPNNLTLMRIGSSTFAIVYTGTIAQLTYYPKRLPNAFLQNLTK